MRAEDEDDIKKFIYENNSIEIPDWLATEIEWTRESIKNLRNDVNSLFKLLENLKDTTHTSKLLEEEGNGGALL